jgi:hypothetical protein
MPATKSIKVVPGQIEFTPEYAGWVFQDLGYVERKLQEGHQPEEAFYDDLNFYWAITPKGAEHFDEMKPYMEPLYYSALKILGLIPKGA